MTSTMEHSKEKRERLISILFWTGLWALMAALIRQDILIVSPWTTLKRFLQLCMTAEFWQSVLTSMGHIISGFLLALVMAVVLSLLSVRFSIVRILLSPFVSVIKAVPVASFIILVLIYVPSEKLSVVISFLMAFPILYENLLEGIRSCSRELMEMAKVFRLSRKTLIRDICFSQVLPYLRAGMSLAVGLAWKSGIASEVIGMPDHSIGEHLYESKIYLDTPDLFAWTLAVILLSLLFEKLMEKLLGRLSSMIEGKE